MTEYETTNKALSEALKGLNLSSIKDSIEDVENQARTENWNYRQFLARLLELEAQRRCENRKTQRIRQAGFPEMKYLYELDRDFLPAEAKAVLPELETLSFIKEGRNIVMYGNPGTGKTHVAIALGIKACLEGYSVFFTSVPQLLTQIREAQSSMTLTKLRRRFLSYDLVICDEFGYVSFDKAGGEQLFNHLSLRTGKKAIITTTNLPFTRWDEVIKDKALCSALADRLCHKAYMIGMTGPSYRVMETQKLKNKI